MPDGVPVPVDDVGQQLKVGEVELPIHFGHDGVRLILDTLYVHGPTKRELVPTPTQDPLSILSDTAQKVMEETQYLVDEREPATPSSTSVVRPALPTVAPMEKLSSTETLALASAGAAPDNTALQSGLSNEDVLPLLHEARDVRTIPIIVCTAYPPSSIDSNLCKAIECLVKSSDLDSLKHKIKIMLENKNNN